MIISSNRERAGRDASGSFDLNLCECFHECRNQRRKQDVYDDPNARMSLKKMRK